jgi:hypothetical protein
MWVFNLLLTIVNLRGSHSLIFSCLVPIWENQALQNWELLGVTSCCPHICNHSLDDKGYASPPTHTFWILLHPLSVLLIWTVYLAGWHRLWPMRDLSTWFLPIARQLLLQELFVTPFPMVTATCTTVNFISLDIFPHFAAETYFPTKD